MNGMGKSQGNKRMYPRQSWRLDRGERSKLRRVWPILGFAVLILSTFAALAVPSARQPALPVNTALPSHVPEQLLVKPRAHVPEAQLQTLFRFNGAMQLGAIYQINVRVLHVPEVRLQSVLTQLRNDPAIEFAEPDLIVPPSLIPNDPDYRPSIGFGWHLPYISAPQAWDVTTGATSVIIAILDTGVDPVPDLVDNLVPGWNVYANTPNTADAVGHGTVVAGAAAAEGNNGIGVAGVAWYCKIMPILISDPTGNASFSAIAAGLTYAADHGARVANVSFIASDSSTVSSAAQYLQSKGGVVTVAAGNNSTFDSTKDNPNVLTVSGLNTSGVLASWSNTGNNVDLCAPGEYIWTTQPNVLGGGYNYFGGTSMAAPVVAGVAALVISANPNLTGPQISSILQQTAVEPAGYTGWNSSYGYGIVNAYKAVLAASGGTSTNTGPAVTLTAPSSGSIVSNTVAINVNVTDTVAISAVSCLLNGVSVATNTAIPAVFSWATTNYPNGGYSLQAIAYDSGGHAGTSAVVSVTVQNPVPDTTPPTVAISSPMNGSTLAGQVGVQVSATDNVGVVKVEWYLNSAFMGSSSTSSASFNWDTTNVVNGLYTLQAKAYDAAGNVGTSIAVSVTVQNTVADTTPPTVQILSPAAGATLSGINSINVSASDNVGVTKVEWYLDATLADSSTSATPAFSWDTTKTVNGTHTLLAKAYDAGGNVGASTAVSVTVQNTITSTTPPSVQITSPGSSSAITQKSTKVYVATSDAVGVTRADLVVDGKFYSSQTVSPAALNWNPVFSWNTSKLSKGSHTLQSVAYDSSGNTNRSTVITVTK